MLIEIKVKTTRIIDEKTRKKTETYLLDKQFFTEAEYAVMSLLDTEINSHLLESYEIQSLRISPIKEVATQYEGDNTFIATLKDIFIDDNGNEKPLRYKVLLWAASLAEAHTRTQEIAQQGYDMHVEGIKEVEYIYLEEEPESQENTEDHDTE